MEPPEHPAEPASTALERIRGLPAADALREAAGVLRSTEPGSHSAKLHVWQKFFVGDENLAWRYARLLCQSIGRRAEQEASLPDVQGLDHPTVLDAAANLGHYQRDWPLRGLIDTVRAAVAYALGNPEAERYLDRAAAAYQEAFAVLGDAQVGLATARAAADDLLGREPRPEGRPRRAAANLLVEGEDPAVLRACVNLVPGETGRLLPDVIRMGLVSFDDAFLRALVRARDFVAARWPLPAGYQVRWWVEGVRELPLPMLAGDSGGAAFAAALRSAAECVPLDPQAAVSATLKDGQGTLGDVAYERQKWQAARSHGIDRVIFSPEVAGGISPRGRSPAPIGGKCFEDAWNHLTGRAQALEAYAREEWKAVCLRCRFKPPGLLPETPPHNLQDLTSLFDQLHIPVHVLTRVRLPGNEQEALRAEMERNRGEDSTRRDGLEEDRFAPPTAVERLSEQEREQVRPFQELFQRWQESGFAPVETVFPDLQRQGRAVVILGDPGYGKSWLIGLLSLLGLRDYLEARQEWLPLRVTCEELGPHLDKGRNLVEAVSQVLKQRLTDHIPEDTSRLEKALADAVRQAFKRTRVLLLIDGWDERTDTHDKKLRDALAGWGGPRLVASRVVGHSHALLPDAPRWQLMPLDGPESVEQLIRSWFGQDDAAGGCLVDALLRKPQLSNLVRVPLLGALVCWLWQRPEGGLPDLPVGRTALLRDGLRELLLQASRGAATGRRCRSRVLNESADKLAAGLLRALSELAYGTFNGERWLLREDDLEDGLERLKRVGELGSISDLKEALTGRFGVFTRASNGRLEILHQSFAEFLCANWVATEHGKVANQFRGWLRDHGGIRLLDPRWQEVWCHLAALLPYDSVRVLLEELWSIHQRKRPGANARRKPMEDVFDAALCLSAHCLAAASGTDRYFDLNKYSIAEEILNRLLEGFRTERDGSRYVLAVASLGQTGVMQVLVPLLTDPEADALIPVVEALGRTGPAAIPHLVPLLRVKDYHVPSAAVEALGEIGPAAAEAIPHLLPLLSAPGLGNDAARALGHIGRAAIPHLLPLLTGSGYDTRKYAGEALGQIGLAAVPRLFPLLSDEDKRVRCIAADILGMIGPAAVAAVPHLVPLLRDPEFGLRGNAAQAIGRMGPAAKDAIPHLLPLLRESESSYARQAAIQAIGRMGPAAKDAIPHLLPLLHSESRDSRHLPALALAQIGPDAAAISQLLPLLSDWQQPEAGCYVALALGRIGAAALPHLLPLLDEPDPVLRARAALALGEIGAAAVPHLRRLLRDRDWDVWLTAAVALGSIGPAAAEAVPGFLPLLRCKILDNADLDIRRHVVEALGKIGPAAVPGLLPLLSDNCEYLRDWGAKALSVIGPAAAPAVPHLLLLLGDRYDHVRRSAEWALARIGPRVSDLPGLVGMLRHKSREARQRAREVLRSWSEQLQCIIFPNGTYQELLGQPLSVKEG